jgi:hypothetical protein
MDGGAATATTTRPQSRARHSHVRAMQAHRVHGRTLDRPPRPKALVNEELVRSNTP